MSILSIGVSGLSTAQTVLTTTSNNITNVYTPGYNRQLTRISEGLVGGGVAVDGIERQFNRFVAGQLNRSSGVTSALTAYQGQVGQVDNLLADREAGLAPLMSSFFSSLQKVSAAPADPAARQAALGSAQTLGGQFRSFGGYLDGMQSSINSQIKDEVGRINNSAAQIARLNREINLAQAKTGEAPNALLDQRDQLVADISGRIDARLTVQDGGAYNLSLANGMSLVSGTSSFSLEATRSSSDSSRMVVGYRDAAGNLLEFSETAFKEGTLGGLMSFRREVLDRTQNQLGQLAATLAQSFNQQHAQGVDLNGAAGGDFFSVGQPQAFSNGNNRGDASLRVGYADAAALTASDYDVSWSAQQGYSVVRRDTGSAVDAGYDSASGTLSFGGVSVKISGTPADGDRFLVQPTRRAASGMAVAISDPAQIAAGSADGSSGTGDNRNMLALQALQTGQLVGGESTFSQGYATLVGDIGSSASITGINLTAQQGLNEQLRALQQSDSGVNLDEEAANLVRYQQFYQANAKIIEIGSSVINTLLGIRS